MSSPMLNLSELRQSAMHLPQAAASFSDAVQAMAAAAQALCNAIPEEDEANTVQISTEDVVVDNDAFEYHDLPGAPNLNDDMEDKTGTARQPQTTLVEVENNENDYYMSDKAQITFQETPNVFLVAPSEGKELYASSPQVLQQTTPWDNSEVPFPDGITTTMESRLQTSLSTVAESVREKAYMDWIETHSRGGQRYMPSWTPAILARYANEYILGVLQYKLSLVDSLSGIPGERPLPQIPAQFVSQHQLEEAVEEGLLEMAIDDSGISHVSHFPSDPQQGHESHKNSHP
ncbi:hypothetical protein RhiLY_03447 [Ceratobasidium sp. AG-Ba]|nr:hypothetical protein RhiLY_03447 [Ceratobasidium sp. AG-Ba]